MANIKKTARRGRPKTKVSEAPKAIKTVKRAAESTISDVICDIYNSREIDLKDFIKVTFTHISACLYTQLNAYVIKKYLELGFKPEVSINGETILKKQNLLLIFS